MKRPALLLALLFLPLPALSGDVREPVRLNLAEVVETAGSRNIQIILADEKIQQALARAGASASELLPHAGLSLNQSRQTRNLESVGIPTGFQDPVVGPFNSFDARLTLKQSLFDWGAVERLRAARAAKRLSEAERVKIREDVQSVAASMYFEAKRAREHVRFAESLLASRKSSSLAALTGVKNGAGTSLEARRAEDEVLSARQNLQEALAQAGEKRRDLLVMLAMDPSTPVLFPVREPSDLWDGFEPELPKNAERHPEIRRLEAVVEDLKAEKRVIMADFLPRVSGVADYGPSGVTPSDWDTTYTLGVKLDWPLLEGGKRLFNLRQARSLLRQADAEKKNALLEVDARTMTALDKLKQSVFLAEVREKQYRTARQEWIFALQKFKNGTAASSERYAAYSAYLQAADDRSQSEALLQLAFIQTAHAMGRMSEWFEKEAE